MNTHAPKTTSSALQPQKGNQPFFNKEGEGAFFSQDQVQLKADNEHQPVSPFFGNHSDGAPFFAHSPIQTKLTIGQPGDQYEQEADAMADQVVQRLAVDRSPLTVPSSAPAVQRKCAACAAEEQEGAPAPKLQPKAIFESNEEQPLQRKCAACKEKSIHPKRIQRMGGPSAASSDLESRLSATKGSGTPLPKDTRSSMESAFGTNFSGVRVHTDSQSMQMNQELGAQAFTHGSDVYFNQGKYDAGSRSGQHLLAHELTHVVQQGGNISKMVQRRKCEKPKSEDLIGCNIPTATPTNVRLNVPFIHGGAEIIDADKAEISDFVRTWHTNGAKEKIRLDGFASCDGSAKLNGELSCGRASSVGLEMNTPSDGSPGIDFSLIDTFAHGETDEFSPDLPLNRRVLVSVEGGGSPIPKPPDGETLPQSADPAVLARGCDIDAASPSNSVLSITFIHGGSELIDADRAEIANFVHAWHVDGANDIIRLDGWASTDGSKELNLGLSCERAMAVANELVHPVDGSEGVPLHLIQEIFAHGETSEFSPDLPLNRRVTVSKIGKAPIDKQNLKSPRFRGNPDLEEVILGKKTLKKGDGSDAVGRIQQAVVDAGFPIKILTPSVFDADTEAAVKKYQKGNALSATGIIDKKTMAALDLYYAVDMGTDPLPPQKGSAEAKVLNILSRGDTMTPQEAKQARDLLFTLKLDEFKRTFKAALASPDFGTFLARLGLTEVLSSAKQMTFEVVIPTTLVKPAKNTIDADFKRANEIYNPQGIEIEKGNHQTIGKAAAKKVIGNDLEVKPGSGKVSKDELNLVKHNRMRNRITGYWVPIKRKSATSFLRGKALSKDRFPQHAKLPNDRTSVMVDPKRRAQDTFAHELGHVLGLLHTHQDKVADTVADDKNNLMTRGGKREIDKSKGKIDQLTKGQISEIMKSIHIELGRKGFGK